MTVAADETKRVDEPLEIAGRRFRSRLILGTGQYKDNKTMVEAITASGTEVVTVAVRRVDLDRTKEEGVLFPVKKTYLSHESPPLGGREKANRGDNFYFAPNPPYGAIFTYYLKESLKTREEMRREKEKKAFF